MHLTLGLVTGLVALTAASPARPAIKQVSSKAFVKAAVPQSTGLATSRNAVFTQTECVSCADDPSKCQACTFGCGECQHLMCPSSDPAVTLCVDVHPLSKHAARATNTTGSKTLGTVASIFRRAIQAPYYPLPGPQGPYSGPPLQEVPYGGPPPFEEPYYGPPPPVEPYNGLPPPVGPYTGPPPPLEPYQGPPMPPMPPMPEAPYQGPPPPEQPYEVPPPPVQPYEVPPPPEQPYEIPPPPVQPYEVPPPPVQPYQGPPPPEQPYNGPPMPEEPYYPPPKRAQASYYPVPSYGVPGNNVPGNNVPANNGTNTNANPSDPVPYFEFNPNDCTACTAQSPCTGPCTWRFQCSERMTCSFNNGREAIELCYEQYQNCL